MHGSLLGRLAAIAAAAGLVLALGRSEQRVAELIVARNAAAQQPAQQPAKQPVKQPAKPPTPVARPPCPSDMVLVGGAFCPDVRHECLEHEAGRGSLPQPRCKVYREPATCLVARRVSMRYCIDRLEHAAAGAVLPENRRSLADAARTCSAEGKRVCLDAEWTFACEGARMLPYPYGFVLDETACGTGRTELMDEHRRLADQRRPRGNLERCVSPFGVLDMAGNLEEHALRTSLPVGIRALRAADTVMKGAYWQPGDHRCRAGQTAHDQYYKGVETGFRCCRDAD
jgi:hypothetical protein